MLTEGIAGFASNIPFSAPDFEFFRQNNRSFTDLAAYQDKEYELSGIDEPQQKICRCAIQSSQGQG